MAVECRSRRSWRIRAPDGVDELLDPSLPVPTQQERAEHDLLPWPQRCPVYPIGLDLETTEHSEVHRVRIVALARSAALAPH